jgi:hypothetical protein
LRASRPSDCKATVVSGAQLWALRLDFMIDNRQLCATFEDAGDEIVAVMRRSAESKKTIAL